MEATKDGSTDGIVEVKMNMNELKQKDIYNISTDVKDVLRLEICTLQSTKENIIDCIKTQQANLSHHEMPSFINYVEGAGLFFAAWIFTAFITKFAKSFFNKE